MHRNSVREGMLKLPTLYIRIQQTSLITSILYSSLFLEFLLCR